MISFKGNQGWLISFGDLLTLLLCLFIANYQTVREPQSRSDSVTIQNHSEKSNIAQNEAKTIQKMTSGTHIAKLPVNRSNEELLFFESDFEVESGKLTDLALQRIELLEIPEGYEVETLHLRLCSRTAEGLSWHETTKRALALQGQLIDTAFGKQPISFEPLGADCDALQVHGKGNPVAVLTLRNSRKRFL